MSYECKILADSISGEGYRLTTMEITFPRFILAELNTHRMMAKNSASSRAIPVAKSIMNVEADPFVPVSFGKNQPGMSWEESLDEMMAASARNIWTRICRHSVDAAADLAGYEVHKSLANRVLEPYKWHTAIVTATEWGNFFALRTAENAQPEFREIAIMMQEAYEASCPEVVLHGWHTPLVSMSERREIMGGDVELRSNPELAWNTVVKIAVGRVARTTHLTHRGVRDWGADIDLHDRLLVNRHMSPFEQVARPFSEQEWSVARSVRNWLDNLIETYPKSNDLAFARYLQRQVEFQGCLRGWHSARMDIPFEHDYSLVLEAAGV